MKENSLDSSDTHTVGIYYRAFALCSNYLIQEGGGGRKLDCISEHLLPLRHICPPLQQLIKDVLRYCKFKYINNLKMVKM